MKVIAAAVAFAALGSAANASLINAPVDPMQIVNYQGLDWVWASPCGGDVNNSCAPIDFSYQAALGWRLPTATEVTLHIASDISAFVNAFKTAGGYACASAWFNNQYSHCDVGDAQGGYIWNLGPNNQPGGYNGYASETFAVRGMVSPVPVPAGMALLGLGLAALGAVRRKGRKQA